MLRPLALAFLALFSLGTAALADAAAPWIADTALARNVMSEVGAQGILSVKPHLADLEAALARAKSSSDAANAKRPTSYVLTDGAGQAIVGMTLASAGGDKSVTESVAIPNPYPQIGLLLGSYYNETGQSTDALRALDAAIASDSILGIAGDMGPDLQGERAIALIGLKRLDDALAAYDDALKENDLPAPTLRGRGYVLTELGRLAEAEQAYKDSLVAEPNNPSALHELQYLAKLRAGAAATQGGIKPLQPPTPQTPTTNAPTQ